MEKEKVPPEKDNIKNSQKGQMPGEGLRSLKTSNVFRTLNFELYTRPVSIITSLIANEDIFYVKPVR